MPDELEPRSYRGRFAPSPTGELHIGSAAAALLTWLSARKSGGALVLRVEDIDTPRVVPGMEAKQLDDLRWLGLDWEEGPDVGGSRAPYRQSERTALYEEAIDELARQGLVYYCDCSRAEIARVASAPHGVDEGPRYPGTCREKGFGPRAFKRPPAIRLRLPERRTIVIDDAIQGRFAHDVDKAVGDFVLRRGDGVYAYQLAVVVDDLSMGITEVVRGFDLLASAPRQALLAELLGGQAPGFAHLPLVVGENGERLAKRARGVSLRHHREAGIQRERVIAEIAKGLGLIDDDIEALGPRELLSGFDRQRLTGQASVRIQSLEACS